MKKIFIVLPVLLFFFINESQAFTLACGLPSLDGKPQSPGSATKTLILAELQGLTCYEKTDEGVQADRKYGVGFEGYGVALEVSFDVMGVEIECTGKEPLYGEYGFFKAEASVLVGGKGAVIIGKGDYDKSHRFCRMVSADFGVQAGASVTGGKFHAYPY